MKCAWALFKLIEIIWLNKLIGLNSLEAGRLFCRTRIYTDSTDIFGTGVFFSNHGKISVKNTGEPKGIVSLEIGGFND